ncbi:14509_t:CDS:2, partial [Ambispora leptoticha]
SILALLVQTPRIILNIKECVDRLLRELQAKRQLSSFKKELERRCETLSPDRHWVIAKRAPKAKIKKIALSH